MAKKTQSCFGVLDGVFPMGEEGLREVVPTCFDCPDRKPCLQMALTTKDGLEFRGEVLRRTPVRGLVGRLKRWSEKKSLGRLVKQRQK